MERSKLATIESWEFPKTKRGLQRFLGFINFYRRFIPSFATATQSLYKASSGNGKLLVTTKLLQDFKTIKHNFTEAVQLNHPDTSKQFVIRGDASDFALGISLSQTADNLENAEPVAFYSRKLTQAELNLPVLEKELRCIVQALKDLETDPCFHPERDIDFYRSPKPRRFSCKKKVIAKAGALARTLFGIQLSGNPHPRKGTHSGRRNVKEGRIRSDGTGTREPDGTASVLGGPETQRRRLCGPKIGNGEVP